MNKRLEELSDKVRKGISISFTEALEVINYQSCLKEELKKKRNNSIIWRMLRLVGVGN